MHKIQFVFPTRMLGVSFLAVLTVGVTTIPLAFMGRQTLGEAVIALLYLVPVTWSANRWGLMPGLSAALAAALCFNFLFIPPLYTFAVGSVEGWMVLAIFLGVAVLAVDLIQANLTKAREAVFMYELSAALCGKRTQEAAARTIARHIRILFQADQVVVCFHAVNHGPEISHSESAHPGVTSEPDRILPIENVWGLVGEIQIWRGRYGNLPPEDSRLLRNFALQASQALERTRMIESLEGKIHPAPEAPVG
jgi:K+-sensing histidine kinase KdpD